MNWNSLYINDMDDDVGGGRWKLGEREQFLPGIFFQIENEVFDQLLHPAITIILLLQLSDTMMKLSYQMRLEWWFGDAGCINYRLGIDMLCWRTGGNSLHCSRWYSGTTPMYYVEKKESIHYIYRIKSPIGILNKCFVHSPTNHQSRFLIFSLNCGKIRTPTGSESILPEGELFDLSECIDKYSIFHHFQVALYSDRSPWWIWLKLGSIKNFDRESEEQN